MNTTGARARRLRLASGLDQTETATRVGISQGTLSKIENGRATSGDEIARLARTLRCTEAYLLRNVDVGAASRPWLRAYADASGRALERQLADCELVTEAIDYLGLRTLPDEIPTFRDDLNDDDAIEKFALDVRAAAGLSAGEVVGHMIRAAERLGCVVLPMREELGRHLGLSLRSNFIPLVCVSRPTTDNSIPGDRQRFTVAHELGHLALHSGLGSPQSSEDAARLERQAHRFAAAFLAPADALLEDLAGQRVTLRSLAGLKARWGVAIKALVVRFHSLGVIDDSHARSLYQQISARGWNKGEPVDVPNESALWLAKAIGARFRRAEDPTAAAANELGLHRAHLDRWTDWTVVRDPAPGSVIDLASRRDPGSRSGKEARLG